MKENTRITIGLAIPNIYGDYLKAQWEALNEIAEELGINLIIFSPLMFYTNKLFRSDLFTSLQLANEAHIDGLILSAGASNVFFSQGDLREYIDSFKPLPVVSISQEMPGIPSLLIDNQKGMENLVSHFVTEHNYKKIAFIRSPLDNT